MKPQLTLQLVAFIIFSVQTLWGNGVVIVNGTQGIYLQLKESEVDVEVNNQIAIVTSKQVFYNQTGSKTSFKYAFPLNANANAIYLSWFINGQWQTATISQNTQEDSIPGTPGEDLDQHLLSYMGSTPLLFTPADSINPDSSVTFIVKYVELLPYSFGKVSFFYPNDYNLIQEDGKIEYQRFLFSLMSERVIESVEIENLNAIIDVMPYQASVSLELFEEKADFNYNVNYQLSSDGLGMYSLSTYLPEELLHCDELGQGFLTLIIEPESNTNTQVIEKNFSLVIDQSGSMSGEKMVQAKAASSFIVNHLNFGDNFNIIDFATGVNKLFSQMTPYTIQSRDLALAYIDQINATSSTNISGALTTSIQEFQSVDTTKANIIIFFTDGRATAGITDTEGILDAVKEAVEAAETKIFLFPFGIGQDVNKKLLTLLALENNGTISFLENDEVEVKITEFFLRINNPVLLNTEFQFLPDIVHAVFPDPLPNLYKGQQLIISGRYDLPGEVNLHLSGKAFNLAVDYDFTIQLADSNDLEKSFLPKIWAKQAIDNMTIDYHLASSELETDSIQALIDSLSICYGVISTEFTSFEDGGGDLTSIEFEELSIDEEFGVFTTPNPFRNDFTIHFLSKTIFSDPVSVLVLDNMGNKVALFEKNLFGVQSSILCTELALFPSGVYYCIFSIGGDIVIRRIVKI